jgi:hypothetical protein
LTKRIIITCIILVVNRPVFSQNSFSLEITPKLTYARFVNGGNVPAGFHLQPLTPNVSSGAYFEHLSGKHSLAIGFNYHINRYKSTYRLDYKSENNSPNLTSVFQSSYFEPQIAYTFQGFKTKGIYIRTSLGYTYTNPNSIVISSTFTGINPFENIDTVKIVKTYRDNKAFRIKLMFEIGKRYSYKKIYKFDIGLKIRLSHPEIGVDYLIKNESDKLYNFAVLNNSSFIGINIRFGYLFKTSNN